jgi:NAD-dependent DNA ligase
LREYKLEPELAQTAQEVRLFLSDVSDSHVVAEFFGLCQGLFAKEKLDVAQTLFLKKWLEDQLSCRSISLLSAIYAQLAKSTTLDGTPEKALLRTEKLVKTILEQRKPLGFSTEVVQTEPIKVFSEPPPQAIIFESSEICLTGTFQFEERQRIGEMLLVLGARMVDSVRRTTKYLIVGNLTSQGWSNGNYGNKIKRAIEMRESGHPIVIVSEDHFKTLLPSTTHELR